MGETRFLVDQCSVSFVSEVVLMRLEIVLVGPFDWGSTLIIGADVTHDLAVQISVRSTGSKRSSAWGALFSSTQKTAARSGGF
jgi:hypothetical protein